MLVKLSGGGNYSEEWKKFGVAFSSIRAYKSRPNDEKM